MTRSLAFSCFVLAAFDWALWPLDRAGWAALGFAFLALALAPSAGLVRRPARMNLPPKRVELPDDTDDEVAGIVEALRAYGG